MGVSATSVHIWAKLGNGNLLRMAKWMRWHMIRNSNPGGVRPRYPSVTKAPHNIKSLWVSVEETFVFLKPECQSGFLTRDLWFSRQATCFNYSTGPPPQSLAPVAVLVESYSCSMCFCSAWYQVYRNNGFIRFWQKDKIGPQPPILTLSAVFFPVRCITVSVHIAV